MAPEILRIGPQPGPQTDFLSCKADICIFGGAAYGGKSVGLLLDPVRHYDNPYFEGVIFRRTTTQIRNTGGLWDTSRRFLWANERFTFRDVPQVEISFRLLNALCRP